MGAGLLVEGGGWWAPGNGVPGTSWTYDECPLRLFYDGRDIDVCREDGTALCSIPVAALAQRLAAGPDNASRKDD